MSVSRILPGFQAVLLDVNSTFMFGEDRYGPDDDYFATYRSVGGSVLDADRVRRVVDGGVAHMQEIYVDPQRCDSFPQVYEILTSLPVSADLPTDEQRLLERVIALHEVGKVPQLYAEALRELSRTHRLGIVSNIWSTKEPWLDEFERAGVLELFEALVFSSDGPSMKPSRRLFEQALQQIDLPPSEVVFVGDSLRCDVAGAASAGMKSIWIDRLAGGVGPDDPRPDWIVNDLLDLVVERTSWASVRL